MEILESWNNLDKTKKGDKTMRHVYAVVQGMNNGKVRANEWYITKETPKTVTYSSLENGKGLQYQKNKNVFNKVHLDSKRESTGLWQDAYIFVFAETKEEAIQKAVPIFHEWIELLHNEIHQALEASLIHDFEQDRYDKECEEQER